METITLKGIDLPLSRLCCGGCPAGEYGWGNVDHDQIQSAIRHACELGINFFDTADTYGLGKSETNMGQALRDVRHQVALASKFGVRVEGGKTFYDNSPEYIEKALNDSLRRLNTDYIDLYQIHYLDGVTPAEAIMEALLRQKKAGKIRAIGLSNVTPAQAEAFRPFAEEIASFQNHYSLAHRDLEGDIQAVSAALNIRPLTWGSLGQGILTGKYGPDVHFESNDRRSRAIYDNFYGDKLQKNLRIVEAMRPMAQTHNVPVSAVAVRWILQRLSGSVVIAGMKNPHQADSNAKALAFHLSDEEMETLDQVSR